MRRQRSAKIVATLGPASSSRAMLRALFDAGVDVFRCNFSHGTHDDHRKLFAAIRQVEHDTGRPVGILADLQGPKLRLGNFSGGRTQLAVGAHFRLDLDDTPGDETRAPLPHPEVFRALEPGNDLLAEFHKEGFHPIRLLVQSGRWLGISVSVHHYLPAGGNRFCVIMCRSVCVQMIPGIWLKIRSTDDLPRPKYTVLSAQRHAPGVATASGVTDFTFGTEGVIDLLLDQGEELL